MNILNKSLFTAITAASVLSATAAERQFSYPADGESIYYFGNSKAETYDVAIRISDPSLVGKQITGLSVPVTPEANVSNPSAWLSKELKLSGKNNAPDVASVEASVADDVLTATFSEPYTITADGIYVGYTFTIAKATTDGDKSPVTVSPCSAADGWYIHSSRTDLKWISKADLGYASCLEVTLAGDFPDYAVGIASVTPVRTDREPEYVSIPVTLTNYSVDQINSIEYTVAFDNEAPLSGGLTLESPIPAKFGSNGKVTLSVPRYDSSAEITVAIIKVNGQDNVLAADVKKASYTVMEFVPVTRPLMEEYTGLWCTYCPRGFVAMEKMAELYPDEFVCVSYHDGDILSYVSNFPSQPSGYPSAFLNRGSETDPYYGDDNYGFGIQNLWLNCREQQVNNNIDVELTWKDEDHTTLDCHSMIRFCEDVDGEDYLVNYVLTGDGFKTIIVENESGGIDMSKSVILSQINYYNGSTPLDDSPLWDQVVNGGNPANGLIFNDVAIARSSDVTALPAEVKANGTYHHHYSFDLNAIRQSISDSQAAAATNPTLIALTDLQDVSKLRCVAILLKADGSFVNCNKSALVGTSGVKSIYNDAAATVKSTEWYDLQGRRVFNPSDGLFIRVDRLSDGTIRSTKTVCR